MPTPSILNNQQIQDYGVDPNKAGSQGQAGYWDAANNRYTTNQSGQYLYHGDLGGGNIGWYAAASPYSASSGASPDPSGGGSGTPAAPADPLQAQGQASQTYSTTPGAAPTQNTTNQGTQDVVRNSYLERALQPATVDPNDPVIRQQADVYAAAQERARRNVASQNAESYGATGQVGTQSVQDRIANEAAAQNSASFESQLVANELQNKRAQISDALEKLGGMISGDQARALQDKLAQIDAQLKQASLAQSGALGGRELDIKQALGEGSLNLDLIRTLLQNQQFNNQLGFNIGNSEAQLNQTALLSLLGG